MDYDENDFQSQNFHLVGEDKFSANLRSFALAKFDLDEHLRFDSLVEEEVLLGIQGQANNWIDFPPGNSTLEFSSSAVESCATTRHKNVWSEATSSESVDLLLKSVGEDEMINNKPVIMETSVNDESHGIDNRVDLYLDKDDDHKSYMMNIITVDPKLAQDKYKENLSGSIEGQGEIYLHGLSHALEGEDSRIAMHMNSSNGKFSSDGEGGDNLSSFYNAIETSKPDYDVLCEAVLNKKDVCEVLNETEIPFVSYSNSSVLDSQSLESNQAARLVNKNEKLSTGVFSGGQLQRCIRSISGFQSDDTHDEKTSLIYNDNKANIHMVSKKDALGLLNRKSSYSVFPVNSDGLMADIPYQTKYLNCNSEMCENFFEKEECMNQVAMEQEEKVENIPVSVRSKSNLNITPLTEGYQSDCGRLSFDSAEDTDELDGIRTQLINNSAVSCDDGGVKIDTCMDVIDDKQDPEDKLVEKIHTEVENGTLLLTELPTSMHVHYEAQEIQIEDCGRMSTNSPSFTCEKPQLVVEGNHDKIINVDRQEVKLDEDKDPPCESSYPVNLTDVSSLPIVVIDSESVTPPSTYCKSSVSKAPISINFTEVITSSKHNSVDKDFSLTYTDHCRIISGTVSSILEKVQDLPHAVQNTAEELSLDVNANKFVEKELGKNESLIQALPEPDIIQDDRKHLKISCITASSLSAACLVSEKESKTASVFYPLNTKDTSPDKVLQCDSDSQLSEGAAGLNLAIEQKEPSPCLAVQDSVFSEGNELKLFHASILSNSKKTVDNETENGKATGSDCVEDAIETAHLSNTVIHSSSPVRSIDFTQNDISSSAENSVGDGKTLQQDRNDICYGPQEEKDDILNSVEVPVALDADNLNSRIRYSSQICTGTTAESKLEAQSGNFKLSGRDCGSPVLINIGCCHQNNLDDKELMTSNNTTPVSSDKDEITGKVDGSSDGLYPTSVEDGSVSYGVSTSNGLTETDNCSELSLPNLKMPKDNSQGLFVEMKVFGSSTETPIQGKPKNVSRPSNEKKAGSKGKIKKEARALKQSSEMDVKSSISTFKSVENLGKDKPLVEMREKPPIDCSAMKTTHYLDAQTSSIPDLNSSSSLALSHHHFTDLQQVQLRAQIFVYGALISGMPPDEAYMVSAFGDGRRNLWHGLWHASIERFQNQKSPLGCYDSPSHSRPAIWFPEHVSMCNDVQSKVPITCTTKSGNVIISSSSVPSSTVSLPSPLWSLSYGNDGHHSSISRGTCMNFSQTPPPLPRQSFASRQHAGANSSWLSQSSHPVPWFFSSQISALDGIPQYSTTPVIETAHITPVRDSCGPHTPTVEVGPHRILMHAPDTATTTTAAVLQMETTKGAATSVNNKHTPTTQKIRKRKKSTALEDLSIPSSKKLAATISTPINFKGLPLPSASMLLSSNSQLNVFSHASVSTSMSHIISPSHQQIICSSSNQQLPVLYEETCSKLEQAKLQAEDAAALAASTVKYSQGIWSQLAAHKNSGMVLQIEEKLSSAAVTAAAAASVAKAAAAAANVASAAALQAKLMADEALSTARTANTIFSAESDTPDVGKRLVGIPPVSNLKGMDKIHESSGVISAASEAAGKRVESASSATKRAENFDAIVKAAELAAEAVTQAGTIIAMGDPLPFTLKELLDAGPEDFWKGHDGTVTKLFKPRDMTHDDEEHMGLVNVKVHDGSVKKLDDQYSKDKETQKDAGEGELSALNERDQQFQRSSQGNFSSIGPEADRVVLSSIQKGSVVEVMSDGDGLKGAWLAARVIDMDDNKAYVCYSDVSTTEGKLTEWIVLDNGEKAPKIRTSRSTTSVKQEGARKRRRAHLGSYIWEVGDHVDAWIHDRWWEGTITEKSPGDETKLTVHFPARSDEHVVNAWNLRSSLIWKDGQWMEWSHAMGKLSKFHEGDTPQGKRQRVGRLEEHINAEVDVDVTGKLSKNVPYDESRKPDASRPLVLSAKDRTFCIGKNSSEQVTSDALKQKRTGLQKEGSRVVFGVPRPGKKRKFMEVSKHYVANKSDKISEGNDSIKFAKYLMPQASRQPKNTSKIDCKGKKAVQVKTRGGVKTVNSQSFQIRSVDDKEKGSFSASNDETVHVHHKDVISSFKGSSTNCLDKMNAFKFGCFQNHAEKKKVSAVESDHSMHPATAILSKKKSTPGSQEDLAVKQTSTDKTSSVEDKGHGNLGKPMHEVMEPRRSNRRIQPTSRLLEGLQSSLVISKVPSVTHERKPPRGGSSSRGNARG